MNMTTEQKGRRAKEILEDDVFLSVVDETKSDILMRWNLTDFSEINTRESLYHQGRALDEVLRGLRTLVDDLVLEQSRNKTKQGLK
jgi:hypothetical protein